VAIVPSVLFVWPMLWSDLFISIQENSNLLIDFLKGARARMINTISRDGRGKREGLTRMKLGNHMEKVSLDK
jgi:hypothetical protein